MNSFLIYNPNAGKLSRRPSLIPKVQAILADAGRAVTLRPTAAPGDASRLARECVAAGADHIYVVGGDGTINEVINGMAGSQVPLTPLPGGTANCLAVELGIGTRLRSAARRTAEFTPKRIPLGKCRFASGEERYFIAMAGAGVDADIVRRVNPWLKRSLGKAAYWVAGFTNFFNLLPELQLENGLGAHRGSFALASRIRNYGGDLEIAREVRIEEPYFETVLFEGRFALGYTLYLLGVLTRTHHTMPGVRVGKTDRLRLAAANGRPVYLQLDGEQIGELPAELEVVPNALSLCAPWKT